MEWVVKNCVWNTETKRAEPEKQVAPTPSKVDTASQPKEPDAVKNQKTAKVERTYTPEQDKQAFELATTLFASVQAGTKFKDLETMIEKIRSENLSELVKAKYAENVINKRGGATGTEEYKKLAENGKGQLTIAEHYYKTYQEKTSKNKAGINIEQDILKISRLLETESDVALVDAAHELYVRVAGLTSNEGLVSFALAHRKDWPQIERIFNANWSCYYAGSITSPILAKDAMKDELGLNSTYYMSIQNFAGLDDRYKFDPMGVAIMMKNFMNDTINDNEEAFVNLVEMAASEGKLKEVEEQFKKQTNGKYTIESFIKSEGFSADQIGRLNVALKGFIKTPLEAPSVAADDSVTNKPAWLI